MSENSKFSFMKNIFNGKYLKNHYIITHFLILTENDYLLMASSINDWMKQNVDSLKFDQEKNFHLKL